MKNSGLLLALILTTTLGFSQIRDSLIWVKLDRASLSDGSFKAAAQPLRSMISQQPQTTGFRDTLFNYMDNFEKAISAGKAGSLLDASVVKKANQKYPGKTPDAIRKRLVYYGEQMKDK